MTLRNLYTMNWKNRKEIEGRRLNIVCFNIPESKQAEIQDRLNEDVDFLTNLFDIKLNFPVSGNDIKPVMLRARKEINGTLQCRPLRFSVRTYEVKRQLLKLLKAGMVLRNSEDELFCNIYLTPDLTERQREEAFKLRQENECAWRV